MSKLDFEKAKQFDEQDPLQEFRNQFYIPNHTIYFDGNSLGLLSKQAEQSLFDLLNSWKRYGIDGWQEGEYPWFYLSEKLGEKIAPLVGADPSEVIITGSTTVNLHQLVATFFQPTSKRTNILADELNFPSDIYALQSQLRIKGLDPNKHLVKIKSRDQYTLQTKDIINAMTDDIALIVLPSILYRSGQILDMKTITKEAHKRNIMIGFDICHSIGAIPHQLSEWGVDFAFWCTYKHLNGGPGSVGGLYVNQRHFGHKPGLAGWFSSNKQKQFDMEHTLQTAKDAGAFQIGTPHILSIAPLIGSLKLFHEAGIENIRAKSLKLTQLMIDLIQSELYDEFEIVSPLDDKIRGGHILLEHPEAARICHALKADNVIPDFRPPNGIRLSPVALYNTFQEVWHAIFILKKIMKEKRYKQFKNERGVIA